MKYLLSHFETSHLDFSQVYAVYHPDLNAGFNAFRTIIASRHVLHPDKFRKSEWSLSKDTQRRRFIDEFQNFVNRFEWNASGQVLHPLSLFPFTHIRIDMNLTPCPLPFSLSLFSFSPFPFFPFLLFPFPFPFSLSFSFLLVPFPSHPATSNPSPSRNQRAISMGNFRNGVCDQPHHRLRLVWKGDLLHEQP